MNKTKAVYIKNDHYYCKKHAKSHGKQLDYEIPPDSFKKHMKDLNKVKVKKLQEIAKKMGIETTKKVVWHKKPKKGGKLTSLEDKSTTKENTIIKITTRNLTKQECIDKIEETMNDEYLNFYYKKNANEYSMVEYGILLKKKFAEAEGWLGTGLVNNDKDGYKGLDLVLIENQIGPKALRMKTLQGMITQHFIENNVENIIPISAQNKLKDFIDGKTTYAERKKESVIITRKLIKEKEKNANEYTTKYLDFFEKHTKKDDLADCYLQGLYYIKHFKHLLS